MRCSNPLSTLLTPRLIIHMSQVDQATPDTVLFISTPPRMSTSSAAAVRYVLTLANPASDARSASLGGLLATALHKKGVRGVVTSGRCRDLAELRALDFPVRWLGTCLTRSVSFCAVCSARATPPADNHSRRSSRAATPSSASRPSRAPPDSKSRSLSRLPRPPLHPTSTSRQPQYTPSTSSSPTSTAWSSFDRTCLRRRWSWPRRVVRWMSGAGRICWRARASKRRSRSIGGSRGALYGQCAALRSRDIGVDVSVPFLAHRVPTDGVRCRPGYVVSHCLLACPACGQRKCRRARRWRRGVTFSTSSRRLLPPRKLFGLLRRFFLVSCKATF